MKRLLVSVCVLAAALLWVRLGPSQPPDRGRDAPPPRGGGEGPDRGRPRMPTLPIVEALDLDGDGVISEEEMKKAAESLKKLDKNKDGKLTMEEIYLGPRVGGPGRPGGPGGPGRPGGPGAGGPGLPPLPPGMRNPLEPGQVLAPPVRQRLKLTDEQKKEIESLEKQTREKVMKILTREQKEDLAEMLRRGPGLPGGRDGPGGRPGREGPPPGPGDRPPPPLPPAERPERPPQG